MDQTPIRTETRDAVPVAPARRRSFLARLFWPDGLSGKLLIITAAFIMLAEILIFVPSVANYRLIWLKRHFNSVEIAATTLSALPPEGEDRLRLRLLDLTETELIAVRRDGVSEILATRDMPSAVDDTVMVEEPGRVQALMSVGRALDTLFFGGSRTMRVSGPLTQSDGTLEIVMSDAPLRAAMLSYARNVFFISLSLALLTALLVFLTLRAFLIRPLQKMTGSMLGFARDPQDARQIIEPTGRRDEIGVAEEQFSAMQKQLRGQMNQQRRLADLGLAVSKINHDLRNILASASLFSDRLTSLDDPTVQRLAPRLIRTIDRAADYTSAVLEYGKAGEREPKRSLLHLHKLVEEVAQTLALDTDSEIEWVNAVPTNLEAEADPEQLFRVLLNLCRNAVQAMNGIQDETVVRRLTVSATDRQEAVVLVVADTGPGIPETARHNLFSAFGGTTTKGGSGLGLAIAAEIVRAHGGTIRLVDEKAPGTRFEITLPKG